MIKHYNTNIPIANFNNFIMSDISYKGKIINHTFNNFNLIYSIFLKKIAIGRLYGVNKDKSVLLKIKKG